MTPSPKLEDVDPLWGQRHISDVKKLQDELERASLKAITSLPHIQNALRLAIRIEGEIETLRNRISELELSR